MCRITGAIDFSQRVTSKEVLVAMRDSLSFGGPDSAGIFIEGPVGLAHRRLAIIDLSESGAQPMISGEWVISFNGEIYNYQDIRKELVQLGYTFSTVTDTEVIIKSIDVWGVDGIKKFRGMFAFALWNRVTKKLLLCRDRFGVKPLFYYQKDDLFLFASELKAFHEHPLFDKTLDVSGIPYYLQRGYFKEDDCIYKYVRKVSPGTVVEVCLNKVTFVKKYYDVEEIYNKSIIDTRHEEELKSELEELLSMSFRRRLISDVEVGIFLSSGVDSSLVTALLQKDSSRKLRTFTIGFNDVRYNEADVAQKIADHLGTDHSTLYCTEEDFQRVVPLIPEMYDEPFGDSSAIPTYLVSRMARQDVKVALSGDGGDELFGGYSKYLFATHAPKILSIPYGFREQLHKLFLLITPQKVAKLAAFMKMNTYSQVDGKYFKFRQTLLAKDIDDFFEKSSSYIENKFIQDFITFDLDKIKSCETDGPTSFLLNSLSVKDILNFLPGDVLTKVDRASMYTGLEAREPFLDPEIVDFASTIPQHLKITPRKESKYILKQILGKYLPKELIYRPKQGFTVPIEEWLHGFLRDELTSLQNDVTFFENFQLNQQYFRTVLHSFFALEHKYNHHFIWFVYCLYKWYKRWV